MSTARHSFTLKWNTVRNSLVSMCSVYAAWTPQDAVPPPRRTQFCALWDTGATHSMVTRRVVEDLGLQPERYIDIFHVGGMESNAPIYYVNLEVFASLHFPNLSVVEGKFIGTDVIIGMDIINRGDFAISNKDGATNFSFRIPSIEEFDFAADDNGPASSAPL